MEEKRKYPRYKLAFPIECQTTQQPGYSYTVTKDLSLGGAKIISEKFIPKGKVLKMKLNLIKQVFSFKTKIAWCRRERFSDRYSLGCEFIEIPQHYQSQYHNFLQTIN